MGVQYMCKEEEKGGYSMRFPNAFKGVSKMFAAEILKLIATGLTVATGVAGIVSASGVIQSAVNGAEITEELVANNINVGGVIVAGILGVGAMILYIIAYIMNLVGLAQAGRDEENFGSAFGLSIAVLVISIATAVLTGLSIGGNVPENIASTARTVCEVIVMILVVSGIMNLAESPYLCYSSCSCHIYIHLLRKNGMGTACGRYPGYHFRRSIVHRIYYLHYISRQG